MVSELPPFCGMPIPVHGEPEGIVAALRPWWLEFCRPTECGTSAVALSKASALPNARRLIVRRRSVLATSNTVYVTVYFCM